MRIQNFDKFRYGNKEDESKLLQNLRFYIALHDKYAAKEFSDPSSPEYAGDALAKKFGDAHGKIQGAYQAFTTAGDFPQGAKALIDKYHALTNYDNGYESIFDVRNFEGMTAPGFTIQDVVSGMTFERIPIGDKIKLKGMSGTEAFVQFQFYGGGLNWHKSLFMNQAVWALEDNAKEFVNKAFSRRAQVHYALIEAAMATKACIALNDPGCGDCTEYSYALARAINLAATRILLAVQNKGYGTTINTPFIILAPLQLMNEVKLAMDLRLQPSSGTKIINFNFQPLYTTMLANTNRIGVVLPKMKIKSGTKMSLKTFDSFDMLTFSEATAGWMAYGAGFGDTDQIECIDATPGSGMSGGPIS